MSDYIKLYPYGFLFSNEKSKNIPEQYSSRKIFNKYYYYFDSIYEPYILETKTSFIIIHGHFVHVGLEENINNSQLTNHLLDKYINNYDEFLNMLDFLAGRFVIIISAKDSIRIYSDAANSRSTYYTLDNLIIASHPNLIADNFQYEKDLLHNDVPLLSVTLDYSPYLKIRRVLPNHYVDMNTHSSTRFYPRESNKYTHLSEEQRFKMLEHLWKSQLKYYNSKYENIVLSLSGGNDSRLSLAMSREYNEKIKTFTYTTKENDTGESGKFSKIMSLDQYIVKQMLKDISLNHRFFYMQNKTKQLSNKDIETLDRNTIKHHGRAILPYYMEAFPEERVLHIRTSVLEITTAYYYKTDKKNAVSSAKNTMKNGFKKYFEIVGEEVIDKKLDEALERLNFGENMFDYHILDLYFWENRIGAWHTEVLNETDSAFDTLLPFNHRAIIEIASSFPLEIRRSEQVFKELINRNHPILNFYGINEKSNLYEQYRDQLIMQNESKIKLFTKFSVVNKAHDKYVEYIANDNTIYLPEKYIDKNNFSETSFVFNSETGIVMLEIYSKYLSKSGRGYLQYSILKNGELLLSEDIANWNHPNQINIMNMEKGDVISLRIAALKNSKAKSWENASKIIINNYKEVKTKQKNEVAITCTSPYSIIT